MAFLLVSERVLHAYLADMVELNHRKVGIRCLVKAENNKESLSKTTRFSLSQMNNVEPARTLSWRENALLEEREKNLSLMRCNVFSPD